MSGKLARLALLMVAVIVVSSCAVLAQSATEIIYPGYHGPSQRTGQNPDARDITNPGDLTLIWTYPRTPSVPPSDNMLDEAVATYVGTWNTGNDASAYPSPGPSDYLFTLVDATGTSRIDWAFPAAAPGGKYKVYVWYPANPPIGHVATREANYTVTDRNGSYTFAVDQSQNGGQWVRIGTTFEFDAATQFVRLSSISTDITPAAVAMADGVRFERDTSVTEVVMDDSSTDGFQTVGTWNTGHSSGTSGLVAGESYSGGFRYKETSSTSVSGAAVWRLPPGTPSGKYMLYTWFPNTYENNPSGHSNTSAAVYVVGSYPFTIPDPATARERGFVVDQSDESAGGTWVPISERAITLSETNTIILLDYSPEPGIVAADAIRLVPVTDKEFFASPVAANLPVDWDFGADGTFEADIPVAYTASIDPPLIGSDDPQNTGSIVCVNGVTPALSSIGMDAALVDRLRNSLGTALWEYPSGDPALRDPLEGPIQNGFYSTPTLVYYLDSSVAPAVRRSALVATGMDGQIYALDAEGIPNSDKSITQRKARLLWKGPGITESEPYPGGPYPNPNPGVWESVTNRVDAFGGAFLTAECTPESSPASPIVWRFDETKRKMAGEPGASSSDKGWAYDVRVWIPALGSDVNGRRPSQEAVYVISYGAIDGPAEQTVVLDISKPENQGRWASLGVFFNVNEVKLQTTNTDADPTDFAVVADACMIVPEQVGAFGYSSPVADINQYGNTSGSENGRVVYAVTADGRAMSMDISPVVFGATGQRLGKVNWFYPEIREDMLVTGSDEDTKPGLGPVIASASYSRGVGMGASGRLLVATTDEWGGEGRVYSLRNIDYGTVTPPVIDWQFPSENTDRDRPLSFSSSPAISPNGRVYIGSEYGSFFCFDLNARPSGTSQAMWKYPASPSELPLGAFRYSTPAFSDINNTNRVWIGSADGRIYSFNAEDAVPDSERRMSTSTSQYYVEPDMRSAVYGSPTLDGGVGVTKPEMMFAGTMEEMGVLRWYLARSGMVGSGWPHYGWPALGQIFSSPTPAQANPMSNTGMPDPYINYVYFTASDGRLYALSMKNTGAWGGEWQGGAWLYDTDPNENPLEETLPTAAGGDVQFELVSPEFFQHTFSQDPEPRDTTPPNDSLTAPSDWDNVEWVVRRNMKLISQTDAYGAGGVPEQNNNIAGELADRARNVRDLSSMLFPNRTHRLDVNRPVYVEWGESLYFVVWNLDPDQLRAGQASVEIKLHNASPGSGAGMELNAKVKAYKEYTVLNSLAPDGGTDAYRPLTYAGSTRPVRRAFLLAQLDLKSTGSKPPSPGPGWEIYAKINKSGGVETIDLAKLTLTGTHVVPRMNTLTDPNAGDYATGVNAPATQYTYDKLDFGINNPLAIRDDGSGRNPDGLPNVSTPIALAWGLDRNDPAAHFNGNSMVDSSEGFVDGRTSRHLPILWVRNAAHGATTSPRTLGIMDRSAGGAHAPGSGLLQQISNFRIASWDLGWHGGEESIEASAQSSHLAPKYGKKFRWELGIGSVDYPDILRRYHNFRTMADGKNPARVTTQLPAVQADTANPDNYDAATPRPDRVEISVDVPRFQPANTYNDGLQPNLPPRGYSRVMTAYVDSNRNGSFDAGTVRLGRPTTYQEAYRLFRYEVTVAPDPRIEVKETTVDVGVAPHGLGIDMGWDFSPFTEDSTGRWTNSVKQWFKKLTVRNLGNVNLYNLRVDKNVMLIGDGAKYPIPGEYIMTSLDKNMLGTPVQFGEPITTSDLGYTLTKARVGDPDPTTLTIPDKRKWNAMSLAEKNDANDELRGEAPLAPMVSVRVPLSQPVGTYIAKNIRVYSDIDDNDRYYQGERDWNGDGILNGVGSQLDDENGNGILDPAEPSTDPGFDLTITVKENQMTGGVFNTSLPQIDDDPASRVTDTGSAAFRDPVSGNVVMFYSSNKRSDPPTGPLYPDWDVAANDPRVIEFARAPSFLHRAVLGEDTPNPSAPWRVFWRTVLFGAGLRWWDAVYDPIPDYQWPDLDQDIYGTSAIIPYWQFNNADTGRLQVKHSNPAVTVNEDNNRAYLVWSGSAEISDAGSGANQRTNEERIFFADVTGGNIDNSQTGITTVSDKPNVAKRNPSVTAWGSGANERIALFWQGMMGSRWGIFFNTSDNGTNWSPDAQVRTSVGLSTVGNPSAVYRYVHQVNGGSGFDADIIDLVYAGTGKITRNADILLSRYSPVTNNRSMISPTKRALPLPRVFNEKLIYSSRYGFYNSEHTAWVRLDPRYGNPTLDNWGGTDTDLPFIQVELGDGYEPAYPAGTVVSATDGSVNGFGGMTIRPKVDSVTGVYTYEYPVGSPAEEILGKAFVDYSEGVIKFSKPLLNASGGSGPKKPEVYADYTPQSWRLTTDLAVDSSPRAFVETTQMTPAANPGMCEWVDTNGDPLPAPVDRLWVMWRKASAGAKGNVVYYKTYRMGIDLTKIGAKAIRINPGEQDPYGFLNYGDTFPLTGDPADDNGNTVRDRPGSAWDPVTITGAVGPFEVDATGTKIFFSQVDERYPEMDRLVNAIPSSDPGSGRLGRSPGPVRIQYTDVDGDTQDIDVDTIFWIPEIEEQSLSGQASTANVNEGSIWAFADPNPPRFRLPMENEAVPLSKVWLFWTSTRNDNTDIYWETVFPGLTVK